MSQYDFDNNQDGDWEDPESTAWNEADWQIYLRNSDQEIAKFITAYNKCRDHADRLESASKIMGWMKEDWTCIDDVEIEEDQIKEIRPLPLDELQKMEPYTVHKHPVYISSVALFTFLRSSWEHMMMHNRKKLDPQLSWSYCSSLSDAEKHAILAANCLDLGDFLLALNHLKRAHAALNESMRINRLFSHHNKKIFEEYLVESDVRMHDLREIWLRVMCDCRR
jgi:hypothetical protein